MNGTDLTKAGISDTRFGRWPSFEARAQKNPRNPVPREGTAPRTGCVTNLCQQIHFDVQICQLQPALLMFLHQPLSTSLPFGRNHGDKEGDLSLLAASLVHADPCLLWKTTWVLVPVAGISFLVPLQFSPLITVPRRQWLDPVRWYLGTAVSAAH